MQTKFKKLTMADNQDYGNGDEMHNDEYNGNGMEGQDNSYDQPQHSNGNNDNSGRDDDRWVGSVWAALSILQHLR